MECSETLHPSSRRGQYGRDRRKEIEGVRGRNRNWSIPPRLIEAVRTKGIAFLVGAGASLDAPANVPAWMQLAKLLDAEIGEGQIDRFNSKVDDPGQYIWKRIKEDPRRRNWIIDKIEEKAERSEDGEKVPSDLHRTIMHMAWRWGGDNVLVLTTNYDLLLEAAVEQGADWLGPPRRWAGQGDGTAAAPRGIYHLHGTLEDRTSILLTDEEMTNHYTANGGREAKYLGDLFRDRMVLAIGYGFRDPEIGKILDSISREAPGETYAIIEGIPGGGRPPEVRDRVKEIMYANGEHREVKEILRRINEMAIEEGAAAQARAYHETGRMGPGSATPDTWKQIEELIRTGDANLEHFLRGAMKASDADEWICVEMLEAGLAGVFRLKDLSEGERHLCGWLSLELTGTRLRKVLWAAAVAGGIMHPELRFRIGRELQDMERTFSIEDLRLGIEALCSQAAGGGFNDTDALMLGLIAERVQKQDPTEMETGLEVLRVLTEVVARPEQEWQIQEDMLTTKARGSVKAATRSDGHTIEEAWEKLGERLVEKAPGQVWEIAVDGLRRQQRITDIGGGKRHSFNSWNYGLPAIEERHKAPDWRRGGSYVLVDAACRGLGKMGSTPAEKERWIAAVERAIKEGSPLLRRIVVDSVRTTTHWSADAKLAWVADQVRMNDWWSRHERYLLVKETWANAREVTKETAAKAIAAMVPMTGQETPKEKIVSYARADMIRWLRRQGIVHREMEWERLQEEDPDIGERMGMEDRPKWGGTAHWIGPNRPKQGDELIEEWRRRGSEALEEAIDWEPPVGDPGWPNGPNLEGAEKAVEEATVACLEYGLAFSRILSDGERWDHWGWESLIRAMPKHLDTPAGRQWLKETRWVAVTEGNTSVDWEEMLLSASKHAWDEGWSNETMEVLYRAANRTIEARNRRERRFKRNTGGFPGMMAEAINEPEGKAIEAILTLWKLQVKREKAGEASTRLKASEMVRVAGRLATSGNIRVQKYATVLLARDYGLVQQEAADVARQAIHEKLDSKDAMWRDVVWEGLAYCNHWNHSQVGEGLKEAMRRDLMEQEDPPETGLHGTEKDQVADKYGYTLAMKVWNEDENYGEGWQIGEMPRKRRQAVVRKICNIFDRTEAVHADGWRKLLVPVWEDVAGESGKGTTEIEQEAWMACFRHLNEDEQGEFVNEFKKGPAASPDKLIGHRDEASSIGNREAALKILLHCSDGGAQRNPREKGFWKWQMILDVVQNKWRSEASSKNERQLIDDLLALHGREV